METIEQVFEEFNVPFVQHGEHHHATRGWINIDCPFCSSNSNRFLMGFNLTFKGFVCWQCGPHKLVETLVELTGETPNACYQWAKLIDRKTTEQKKRVKIKRKNVLIPKDVDRLQPPHIEYLTRRGFNPVQIKQYYGAKGIGLSTDRPDLQWRIFIPIVYSSEVVSWTTRSISDEVKRRYITASKEEEKINIKMVLYNEDHAKDSVIVVEGPLDVWAIGDGAVSTMGVAYSQAQFLRLLKYKRRIICFDSEKEAQIRARTLCDSLSPFNGETINVCLDAKDPGSASQKEIKKLRVLLR